MKILIADSDTYVLMTLQAIMGSLGHQIVAESILTAAELSRILLEHRIRAAS